MASPHTCCAWNDLEEQYQINSSCGGWSLYHPSEPDSLTTAYPDENASGFAIRIRNSPGTGMLESQNTESHLQTPLGLHQSLKQYPKLQISTSPQPEPAGTVLLLSNCSNETVTMLLEAGVWKRLRIRCICQPVMTLTTALHGARLCHCSFALPLKAHTLTAGAKTAFLLQLLASEVGWPASSGACLNSQQTHGT